MSRLQDARHGIIVERRMAEEAIEGAREARRDEVRAALLAEAQVHATLALGYAVELHAMRTNPT